MVNCTVCRICARPQGTWHSICPVRQFQVSLSLFREASPGHFRVIRAIITNCNCSSPYKSYTSTFEHVIEGDFCAPMLHHTRLCVWWPVVVAHKIVQDDDSLQTRIPAAEMSTYAFAYVAEDWGKNPASFLVGGEDGDRGLPQHAPPSSLPIYNPRARPQHPSRLCRAARPPAALLYVSFFLNVGSRGIGKRVSPALGEVASTWTYCEYRSTSCGDTFKELLTESILDHLHLWDFTTKAPRTTPPGHKCQLPRTMVAS
ncbi:hypothetical protein CBL_09082 [Carabus blaptoides fortunei]